MLVNLPAKGKYENEAERYVAGGLVPRLRVCEIHRIKVAHTHDIFWLRLISSLKKI